MSAPTGASASARKGSRGTSRSAAPNGAAKKAIVRIAGRRFVSARAAHQPRAMKDALAGQKTRAPARAPPPVPARGGGSPVPPPPNVCGVDRPAPERVDVAVGMLQKPDSIDRK